MIKEVTTNEEFDEVVKEGRVLVDFYAVWCGPCKMLAPIVEKVAEDHPEIALVRVNVDEAPDLAARFGIASIPTLFYFNNGEAKNSLVGYVDEDTVKQFVEIQ